MYISEELYSVHILDAVLPLTVGAVVVPFIGRAISMKMIRPACLERIK